MKPLNSIKVQKLLMALASLGMLVFVLNLLVDNPYSHRLVRTGINEKVEEYTNLTVDFQALKINLLPLGLDLYGLRITSHVDPKSPMITAGHIGIRLSLWSLILGRPRLSLLESRDLTVIWPPPWNFPGILKQAATTTAIESGPLHWPPDFALPIEAVELHNARVHATLPIQEQVPLAPEYFIVSVVGADVDATLESWRDISASIHLQSINAAAGANSYLEDTSLNVEMNLRDQRLHTERLQIEGERLYLDGQLDLDLVAPATKSLTNGTRSGPLQRIDIKLDGDTKADLSLLGSYLDLSDTHGRVDGKIDVKASIPIEPAAGQDAAASFLVQGDAKVHDGYLSGFRLYDSAGRFQIDDQGIAFPKLDVLIGDTSYGTASGGIKFNDSIDYNFRAKVTDLRFLDLMSALKISFNALDFSLASPDLSIKGKGDPFILTAEATTQTSDFQLPGIAQDRTRFPLSPSCRLGLHLAVTSDLVDFNGTQGECYQVQATPNTAMPHADQAKAPAGANYISPLTFSGQVFFSEQKSGLALSAQSSNLHAALADYFAQIPLSGHGIVEAHIKGPFDRIKVEGSAKLADSEVMSIPLGKLSGQFIFDIADERLHWRNISAEPPQGGSLSSPTGSLKIEDKLGFEAKLAARDVPPLTMQAMLKAIDTDLSAGFGIDQLNGELQGPLLFPGAYQGQVDMTLSQASFADENLFDRLQAQVQASTSGISLKLVEVDLAGLKLGGTLQHKRAFKFSFAEAEQSSDPWASLGLHPDDTWEAEVATIDDKEKLSAPAAPVAASQKPSTPATNNADGAKAPDANPQELEQQDPDHLTALPYAGSIFQQANIRGFISATAKVSGTMQTIQGTFKASVLRPVILGAELAPFNSQGFINNGKINMLIDHAGNSLQGRLNVDLGADGLPYEWYFNCNRLDLRAFGSEFFSSDARNYAYLTANWNMRGKFLDWWRSTGDLTIDDIRAKYVRDIASQTRPITIKQEEPVKLQFTENGWHFADGKELLLSGPFLQARLSLPDARPPEKLSIKIDGQVDVSIAKAFSTEIDTASGKLKIAADITGSVSEPKFQLEISDLKPNPYIAASWTPVTFGLADFRPAFRNIKMRILIEHERLIIDSLTAEKGAGLVTASGSINLTDDKPSESRIDVTLADAAVIFQVPVVKSFETQLAGNLSLAGNGPPFRLTGDLKVSKARSTAEVDIRNEIVNALRRQSFKTSIGEEKPLINFDMNILAERSIQITNRNLQTVLSTNLQIKGNDIAPVVLGQIEVNKGKFIYKRDFNIVRGLVTFDDPVRADPSLDILALSEVENYRVYIGITGRASNPTVEFSADPPTRPSGTPLSKLDILVLLSRGALPEENRSIGPMAQGAAASEALNLVIGQFEEPVEKLFDLSGQNVVRNVYIDTYPSTEGNPVPRLNFPLDLGEDFDVVVRADQSASEVSTEYNVHDNITFSSSLERRREGETANQTSSPAGDTKFNLRFRFSFE